MSINKFSNNTSDYKRIISVLFSAVFIVFCSCSNRSDTAFFSNLEKNKDVFITQELYPLCNMPEDSYSNQGFALYKGILFQLYSENKVVLSDYNSGNEIATLDIISKHGDTIDFSNEFLYQDDEFPLVYITADTNPAQVFVVRITRSSTFLVRTYSFNDIGLTGFYAGHCLDAENHILYMVGYNRNNYYTEQDNSMIVSAWDLDKNTVNEDGSLTPEFIYSFNTPFIITVQGQRFYNNKLYLLSSHNGLYDVEINTRIIVIDIEKRKISGIFDKFPDTIINTECEGLEICYNNDDVNLIISTYAPICSKYYVIKQK